MSPVDVSGATPPKSVQALWLVLGEQWLSWGAVCGPVGGPSWQEWGRVDLANRDDAGPDGWAVALGQVPDSAFSGVSAQLPLRVWVADQWVALDVLPWSDALFDSTLAVGHAREHLIAAGHRLSPEDRVQLDDRPWGMPRMVVAYPQTLLDALQRSASRWGLPLGSVVVASVACWAAWGAFARSGRLAVLYDRSLVLLGGSRARWGDAGIGELRVTPLEYPDPEREPGQGAVLSKALRLAWQRHVWRTSAAEGGAPVPLVDARHAVGGALSALPEALSRVTDSDPALARFSGQAVGQTLVNLSTSSRPVISLDAVARPVRAGWAMPLLVLVLGAGLTALGVAGYGRQQALDQRVALLQQQPLRESAPSRVEPLSREDAARVASVNQAIRQLNLPVHALLHALQPPRDVMVAVLSVDSVGRSTPGAQTSSLRILAQARGSEDMTRYVAYVAGRRPFTGASLSKHEWLDEGGEKSLRFSVEATWSD